jgi:hypothetical protein
MDYVTRQFIHLAHKLRDDFRKQLSGVEKALKEISGQIKSYSRGTASHQDSKKTDPPIACIVHRPQAEIDNEESRNARHEERDRNRLFLEAIGVVVAFVVAFATLGQLILTKRAVKIAAVSANAAQESAKASRDAVEVSRKSFETSVESSA